MDKRWLLILFILILGVSCLYVIVDNSLTVGSASQSVGHVIISIPPNFSMYSSDSDSVTLASPNGFKIEFSEVNGGKNAKELYDYRVESLNKSKDIDLLQKGVLHVDDTDVYSVYYHAYNTSDQNEINSSLSYFDKYGHTYFIRIWGFDYSKDYNTTLEYIEIISCNVREDYKQNK